MRTRKQTVTQAFHSVKNAIGQPVDMDHHVSALESKVVLEQWRSAVDADSRRSASFCLCKFITKGRKSFGQNAKMPLTLIILWVTI